MPGPLHALTIIELAGIGPCPMAGQLMADLGAEVILVERKTTGERAYDTNNRNKKSVVLDLKSEEGVAACQDLIVSADVLIEGYRPGVMERLGLGPDACLARNPGLVYARMTGWGQTGPLASTAGHDLNYLSLTGLLHMMGPADAPPMPPLNLVADYGGGSMFLIFGVLAALFERSRSGLGQVVDVAMTDGASAFGGMFRALADTGQWTSSREANLLDGGAPFYRVYQTADGKFLSVAALEPQFFAEFAEKCGMDPALAARRNDRASWREQRAAYGEIIRGRTRDEWMAIFTGSDACVAPVLTPDEALTHPANSERGAFVDVGGHAQPAPAPRFARTPADPPVPARPAGSDTEKLIGDQ